MQTELKRMGVGLAGGVLEWSVPAGAAGPDFRWVTAAPERNLAGTTARARSRSKR
jgi:hypothetical protein